MKQVIFLALTLAIVQCVERYKLDDKSIMEQWKLHKITYGLSYEDPNEEQFRITLFADNLHYIESQNEEYEKGGSSYHVKVTEFSHLTVEEARRKYGLHAPGVDLDPNVPVYQQPENESIPSSFDWRDKGAVTPVKNQGHCGSCWAFSTSQSLEGAHKVKTGKLVSLSEQQLVDCDKSDNGCDGGDMRKAFSYIKNNGGLDTEASYPYTAQGGTCQFNKATIGATCNGYEAVAQDEKAIASALYNKWPLSVGIYARANSFMQYAGGKCTM